MPFKLGNLSGDKIFLGNTEVTSAFLGTQQVYSSGPPYFELGTVTEIAGTFNLGSQDGNPTGFAFKPDGTKMYVVGYSNDTTYQYTLSTPWDTNTATYDNVSFRGASIQSNPQDVCFKPDGTKMFVTCSGSDRLFAYDLTTAWDLSTAVYNNELALMRDQDGSPVDVAFSNDGTRFIMSAGLNDRIYEYTLTTPWNVSTASYSGVQLLWENFNSGFFDSWVSISFNNDGTKLFLAGYNSDKIFQYSLSTPFHISTATYDNFYVDISKSTLTQVEAMEFSYDGSKIFIIERLYDTEIHQYTNTF